MKPNPNPLLLLLLVVAAPAATAALEGDPGAKDGERIQRLVPDPIAQVRSQPGLTAQPTSRLLARTALPFESLGTIRRYDVDVETDRELRRVAFLDVECDGETVRIGVGAAANGALLGPTAFDAYGKPVAALEPFLAQFRGHGGLVLTAASTEPIGDAVRLKDELLAMEKAPLKPAERKRWALFRHLRLMRESGRLHDALQEARQQGEPLGPPLRALASQIEATRSFSANLKSALAAKDLGRYRALNDELAAAVAEALRLTQEGNVEAAAKVVKGKVNTSCSRCHGFDDNAWRKPFEGALRAEREQTGIRAGSFIVDVDVERNGLNKDDAQRLASAVKAGMLLAFAVD